MIVDQIKTDLALLFDDLAEDIRINGKVVKAIIDNELLKEYQKKELDAVYEADVLFFVRKIDLPDLQINSVINFNGKYYTVLSISNDYDVLEVKLSRNGV